MDINGYDPTDHDGSYYFDDVAAERPIAICEKYFRHTKGPLARTPLILADWQKDFVRCIFGWKEKDTGLRRYRSGMLCVPRGNGKSTLAAFLSCYFSFFDREIGCESYIVSTNKPMANATWSIAAGMIRLNRQLKPKFTIKDGTYRLLHHKSNSFLVVGAASRKSSGNSWNSHFLCLDEVKEWSGQQGRDLFGVIETSMGKRTQPFMLITSTCGDDRQSLFWDLYTNSLRVREKPSTDYTHIPCVYSCEASDPWDAESTWIKSNPNYGHKKGVEPAHLKRLCKKAQNQPSFENEFRREHTNCWVESYDKFIRMTDYEACMKDDLDEAILKAHSYTCGLDTSNVGDLSAFGAYWPELKYLRVWFWIPGASARLRSKLDGVQYTVWIDKTKNPHSNITFTESPRIDRGRIVEDILKVKSQYPRMLGCAYDPWESKLGIAKDLERKGIRMVDWGMTYSHIHEPCKETERMIVTHEINVGKCPCLEWNFSNLCIQRHVQGWIRPVKPDEGGGHRRIDGCVASILAIGISNIARPVVVA